MSTRYSLMRPKGDNLMGQTMMPAAWSTLLVQVKPFGDTDFSAVLTTAGELLGFSAAQIEQSGRSVARIGGIRDFSTGHSVELVHSGSQLAVLWDSEADAGRADSLSALAAVVDLALLAKDRRLYETQTPMMAPSGTKDRLTNTIDRDAFADYLDLEFAAGPSNASIMVIGLDGMSVVNDTMSHTVGDIVLAETADRLRDTLRSCDIVSRLGGDVFGIYCPNMPIDTAQRLAIRLQAAVARPIVVQSNELRITAGVGLASRAKGRRPTARFRTATLRCSRRSPLDLASLPSMTARSGPAPRAVENWLSNLLKRWIRTS